MYMRKARHLGSSEHVLWDYANRRRLMEQSLPTNQWNHFLLRKTPEKHMSHMLAFVQVVINSQLDKIEDSQDVDKNYDHPVSESFGDSEMCRP